MRTLGERLLHGTCWTLFGGVASRLFAVLVTAVLGRALGKQNFGYYGIVASAAFLLVPLAGGPISSMLSCYISHWRVQNRAKCSQIITLGLGVSTAAGLGLMAIFYALAGPLAVHVLHAPGTEPLLRHMSLYMLFGAWTLAGDGALIGFQAYREQTLIRLFVGAITLAATVLLVWKWGVLGAVQALNVSCFVSALLIWRAVYHVMLRDGMIPIAMTACSEVTALLRSFALPALLAGIVVGPVNWIGNALLMRTPSGAAEMGVFTAASYMRALVLVLPTVIAPVMLPLMVEALGSGYDESRFRRVASLNSRLIGILVFPITVAVAIASRGIIRLIYGAQFGDAWAVLVLVAPAVGIQATCDSVGQILTSRGRMWLAFSFNVLYALVYLIGAGLAVERWGARGLAGAGLLALLLHLTVLMGLRGRMLGAPVFRKEVYVLMVAGIMSGAALIGAGSLGSTGGLLLAPLCALFAFFALLRVGLECQERQRLIQMIRSTLTRRGLAAPLSGPPQQPHQSSSREEPTSPTNMHVGSVVPESSV